MDEGTKDLCIEDIREAIRVIDNLGIPGSVNINVRHRLFKPIPGYDYKTIAFNVLNLKVNLGGVEIPGEYSLYFDGKEYKVRIRRKKLIVKLPVLESFARYLKK